MVTMLINPFMSCSARLPVYILFISAFFVNYQGSLLFMIYLSGILLAILSAVLFNKTIFRKIDVPFVMELPPYRVPTMRTLLKNMWHRAGQYLKKIGGIILVASILIWALGYFPRNTHIIEQYEQQRNALTHEYLNQIPVTTGSMSLTADDLLRAKDSSLAALDHEEQQLLQEKSFIGQIGHFCEPVMRPLGFDWKMTVSIITGIAGKEVVVSTLGVLHQTGAGTDETSGSLIYKLQNETYDSGPNKGKPVYNKAVALAFIFFILIYFPCIAVVATIRKESGSWKWAAFVIVYTCSIAWIVAFATFQIGSLIFA
jgi:ferrous iron transport protein B